jgi:hypothetical protein
MSERAFPEETNIRVNRLEKICSYLCEPSSLNTLRPPQNKKVKETWILLSLLELGHLSSLALRYQSSRFFGHYTSGLPVLRTLTLNLKLYNFSTPRFQVFKIRLNCTTSSLGSWCVDGRWWDFSTSIITWTNSHNKLTHISIYILLFMTLWRTLT